MAGREAIPVTEATEFLTQAGVRIRVWDHEKWTEHLVPGATINEFLVRDRFIAKFGFAILDDKTVEKLRCFAPILEVGAGSGYWTYELTKAGIDAIATDPGTGCYGHGNRYCGWAEPWCSITRITGADAVKQYPDRTLLMVWPDLGHDGEPDWPFETIAAYTGQTILYVGEGNGGCTGTDAFHHCLEECFEEVDQFAIPQFWGIHDRLQIWQRNRTMRRIKLDNLND
jgi:hypothetical protein